MADITSVMVGGLLAIMGGAVTQWIMHYLKTKAEVQHKRAVKFEALVEAIYEYDHWLNVKRNSLLIDNEHPEEPSPYAKLYAITAVYFPQFNNLMSELEEAADEFQSCKLTNADMHLNDQINKVNYEPHANYIRKKAQLRADLLDYAYKEFSHDAGLKLLGIKYINARARDRARSQ